MLIFSFQVSNGPINNSNSSSPISSNSVQSGLAKSISSTAKMPPSSTANALSPGKQQQQLKPSEHSTQGPKSPFALSMESCPPNYDGMKMGSKNFPVHQRDEQYRRSNDVDVTIAVTATTTSVVSTSSSTTTTSRYVCVQSIKRSLMELHPN